MGSPALDPFDLRLVDALQRDGRLTNNELAERVNLSASQCSRRRTRLEQAGVIRGYRADLDPGALGLSVAVFVQVTLATHSPHNARRFLDLVASVEAIQEAYAMTGEADYLVKMVLPDLAALSRILAETILPHESVAHVRSSIVLQDLKPVARLPLPGRD